MERIFQIIAVILAGVAAYFLWNDNGENAFVVGVFGAASFFLSLRVQTKRRLQEREKEAQAERKSEQAISEIPDSIDEMSANEQVNRQRTTDNEERTKL